MNAPIQTLERYGHAAPQNRKLAALLFDRLVVFRYVGGARYGTGRDIEEIPESVRQVVEIEIKQIEIRMVKSLHTETLKPTVLHGAAGHGVSLRFFADEQEAIRESAASAATRLGNAVVPFYGREESFSTEFSGGKHDVIRAIVRNLPVVSPERIWEQVVDFRADRESAKNYRALRLWLEDGLKANSMNHAVDLIGARLDAYHNALKKHGLRTRKGILSEVLSSKAASPTSWRRQPAPSFPRPSLPRWLAASCSPPKPRCWRCSTGSTRSISTRPIRPSPASIRSVS